MKEWWSAASSTSPDWNDYLIDRAGLTAAFSRPIIALFGGTRVVIAGPGLVGKGEVRYEQNERHGWFGFKT
jgi:hypothetical protein